MQKHHSRLCFQATLTTAGLVVVSADVIIHVILCKNRKTALRRPLISLNGWIPPRGRLFSPCMPTATCSGLWGHKAWMHDSPIQAVAAASTGIGLSFVTVLSSTTLGMRHFGLQRKGVCDLPRGWCGAGQFSSLLLQPNTTLAFNWSAELSPPTQGTDKAGIYPGRLNQGHQHRQSHCCWHWHPQGTSSPTEEREAACMILMCTSQPSKIMSFLFHFQWMKSYFGVYNKCI